MKAFARTLGVSGVLLIWIGSFSSNALSGEVDRNEVLGAMKKATRFMMEEVSSRGGFLWHYSEDLTQKWGEVPARDSQIWVQPPSTPTVGEMLLEAYEVTGDRMYLEYADRVAGALIWGQLPSGGWHYLIDFDMGGIQQWYDEVASQCRGWEEFYHFYGNATFDDDTTTSAARFLLRLYDQTLDAKYRPSVLKAMDFILEAQFPNGAWPQRYPLRYDYVKDGRPDYTSFYTFNDDVMSNNIHLLLEAYEKLGNEEYRKAALRGMDFYLIAQLPSPQAGWAQQYSHDMQPGWARSYEAAAVCSSETVSNIRDLQQFYLITGDRRYLEPIPRALQWLESSLINTDPAKPYTHATFYELGTNDPLYPAHEHAGSGPEMHITQFFISKVYTGDRTYWGLPSIDVEGLRRQYERVAAMDLQEGRRKSRPTESEVDAAKVREILDSLDPRGAWVVDIEFLNTQDYIDLPPTRFRGIDTRTFVSNMNKLLSFNRKNRSEGQSEMGKTTFIDLEKIPLHELLPGVRTRTPFGKNLMFSVVEMDQGSEVPAHSHPHEQGGILLEGRIQMTIGEETRTLEPGDLYIVPPNVEHSVVALGEGAKILDVFSPIREDYANLVNEYMQTKDVQDGQ